MRKYITKYEWRWALIFSIFTILWSIFEFEMGWHSAQLEYHKYLTFLFLIPAGLIYFLFLKDKKSRRYKRRFKFKHAFWSGMGLTLLISIMSIPCQYFIHSWVSPDFIEGTKNNLITEGFITAETATTYLNTKNIAILFAVSYFFMGTIFSILFGAILKGKRKRSKVKKINW